MGLNPWEKTVVQILKQDHVLAIVLPHFCPALSVTIHAAFPQIVSTMLGLLSDPKELGNEVELVARESELLARCVQ
jgi:hypothetical protein